MPRWLVLLGGATVLALTLLGVAWRMRPKPGPAADRSSPVWHVKSNVVEPLGGTADECTLAERAVLNKQHRILPSRGDGVAAACKYVMHLDGWPEGEDECILEFPARNARGLAAKSFGAWLATAYYQHRQGGNMLFTSEATERRFISLDARWCESDSVVDGLRLVP
jgi:hypothetical protein